MGDITLRKALDDYKTIYMPYRNFAERTREEYLNDIEDFAEFLEKGVIGHVKELGLPIIERYIAHLEQKGVASLTRKRRVVAIRSFLSFLFQGGYIDTDMAKRIVLPFAESVTPQVLTQTECNRLRMVCANNPRDKAIVELFLQTGIKLSELVHLNLDDIELYQKENIGQNLHGFIRISGDKGKKDRLIPLTTKAYQALKGYLGIRRGTVNKTLFLNRFDEPLGERGVQKMLRKLIRKAEIRRANINMLRHTFGVYQAATGTSVKTIQQLMGYKEVRSAIIYTSLGKEMIKATKNYAL